MPENDAVSAALELGGKVDKLAEKFDDLTHSIDADRRRTKAYRALQVATVVLVLVVVWLYHSGHSEASCVRAYANSAADRSLTLQAPNLAREKADIAERLAEAKEPDDSADVRAKQLAAAEADEAYLNALISNLPALPPKFTC